MGIWQLIYFIFGQYILFCLVNIFLFVKFSVNPPELTKGLSRFASYFSLSSTRFRLSSGFNGCYRTRSRDRGKGGEGEKERRRRQRAKEGRREGKG